MKNGLPGITTEQMIEVDRIMMNDLSIPVELMMERAGLNLAKIVAKYLRNTEIDRIIVVSGSGNNGAGGMVAARILIAWGFTPRLYLPKGVENLRKTARAQFQRLGKLNIDCPKELQVSPSDLIVDAYIGYGFKGDLDVISKNLFDEYGRTENIICLDAPSGLNTTTGNFHSMFSPKVTATIAFAKQGLLKTTSNLGKLYLIDIGVPKMTYERDLGINWHEHSRNDLERLYFTFVGDSAPEIQLENGRWMVKS